MIKLEDLTPGMELTGTVLNVVDFGAFVDIGLHDRGLVHISQLANKYVRDPHDVVAVGDIVKVWVHEIDKKRRRVSLTMIAPGTERTQPPDAATSARRDGKRSRRRRSRHPEQRPSDAPVSREAGPQSPAPPDRRPARPQRQPQQRRRNRQGPDEAAPTRVRVTPQPNSRPAASTNPSRWCR